MMLLIIPLLSLTGCRESKTIDYLNESREDYEARMAWWKDARFGMFIHWGVYSVPAGIYKGKEVPGIGEWIMDRARIPVDEYEQFARRFNPVKFDAEKWVKTAKNAGMKYIVITSKHHDGFCLWDSRVTDYDIVDFTPFGRDVLKELAEACRKEGIHLGFYYSIMDWHHPDARGERFPEYRENYLKPQLKELLTHYGDIDILWFDGEWIDEWTEEQGKDLYNFVRNLNPDIIVNNRVGKGRKGMQGMNKGEGYTGDFGTPEQGILDTISDFSWETCMTMNDTWGFKKNDHNWKSAETLIHNLIDIASKGGNYLLNVGPDSLGIIPPESVQRLREMGEWLKVNGEAIYGTLAYTRPAEGKNLKFTASKDGKTVYAIMTQWPGKEIKLTSVKPEPDAGINLLGYSEPLEWRLDETGDLVVTLPETWQDPANRACRFAWTLVINNL